MIFFFSLSMKNKHVIVFDSYFIFLFRPFTILIIFLIRKINFEHRLPCNTYLLNLLKEAIIYQPFYLYAPILQYQRMSCNKQLLTLFQIPLNRDQSKIFQHVTNSFMPNYSVFMGCSFLTHRRNKYQKILSNIIDFVDFLKSQLSKL